MRRKTKTKNRNLRAQTKKKKIKTKITNPPWHAIWSRIIYSRIEAYRKTRVILIQQKWLHAEGRLLSWRQL